LAEHIAAGATAGRLYLQELSVSGDVVRPVRFSLAPERLKVPAGNDTDSSGVWGSAAILSGTPTTAGEYPFTITATDENGCSGSHGYVLVIRMKK
jgi:hypothetical protein